MVSRSSLEQSRSRSSISGAAWQRWFRVPEPVQGAGVALPSLSKGAKFYLTHRGNANNSVFFRQKAALDLRQFLFNYHILNDRMGFQREHRNLPVSYNASDERATPDTR
jgi:hypothetical protein